MRRSICALAISTVAIAASDAFCQAHDWRSYEAYSRLQRASTEAMMKPMVLRGAGVELQGQCPKQLKDHVKAAPVKYGAIVGRLNPKGAAAKAGLSTDDVIYRVDKTKIKGRGDLWRWRETVPAKSTHRFYVIRLVRSASGKSPPKWVRRTATIKLGTYDLTTWDNDLLTNRLTPDGKKK